MVQVSISKTLSSLFAIGCIAVSAPAAIVIDIDFQTYNSGTGVVTAGTVKAGASNVFTITNSGTSAATVNPTGSTGITVPNATSAATTGYFSDPLVAGTGGNSGSLSTSGSTGEYRDYFGSGGFNSGTIAFIYQPDFTNASHGNTRSYLFGTNVQGTSSSALVMWIDTDETLRMSYGIGTMPSFQFQLISGAMTWDPNKWYFLAGSWAVGSSPTLYIQEISQPVSTGALTTSVNTLANNSDMTNRIVIGNNLATTSATQTMAGDIAYFRALDTFTSTAEGYNALYTSMVPEPSTYALLAIAGVIAVVGYRRLLEVCA